MRERIYRIIEPDQGGNKPSRGYDIIMLCTIAISMIPLTFRKMTAPLIWIDLITATVFTVDYFLRLFTADFKLHKSAASFFLYPFTPMAIIDLLSILPSFILLISGFNLLKMLRMFQTIKLLKLFRLSRAFKALRALRFLKYSRSFQIIQRVFQKQRRVLVLVALMAIAYIFLSALIIFNVEPISFPTFFDALYWATISLTTIGYGDIYPVTAIGKLVTMISSVLGVAIIALPSGVITAGYLAEINGNKD